MSDPDYRGYRMTVTFLLGIISALLWLVLDRLDLIIKLIK